MVNYFFIHIISHVWFGFIFAHLFQSELPLVGNPAPDFEAEAVFDQEFIKVSYVDIVLKYRHLNKNFPLLL